jgi:hypothetical protein
VVANEPIDEAYVEIKPDVRNFDRDVDRALDRSFNNIEDKLDDLTNSIEDGFERLIATLDIHFKELQHTADKTFDEIQDAARGAGRSIATDIEVGTKIAKHEIDDLADNAHHDFNRIERDARGSGFSIMGIFSKLGSGLANIATNIGSAFADIGSKVGSSLGSTIGQVGSSVGTVTGSIGSVLQIGVMAIAIPLVLGLAGALSQLVGILAALPATAGVAVTAILPLVLAFHGFSDAIGAVLEGDPDKINKALKKLSPSAASVVKEFSKLVKPFGEIQKLAQESLFKPLVGTLTQLATAVLPALRQGVPLVANAFGRMFEFISRAFSNGEFAGVLTNTFATTARIIENITPELGRFADLFISIWQLGLPYVERFVGVLTRGFTVFNNWLEKSIDGGKVTGWLEKAWHVGTQLWQIIKELGIYFGTLLGAFADEGTDTLDGIVQSLQKANEYLKSDKGAETLHNLGVIVHWAGNAFVFLLGSISSAWEALNMVFSFIRGIGPFFASLGAWFIGLWDSIVSGVKSAWHWIQDTVISAWNSVINFFKSSGTNIGSFFVNLWNSIVTGIRNFVNYSINAVTSFPANMKRLIADSLDWVAYHVGYVIGSLIRFFAVDLPNGVHAGLEYLKQGAINTVNNIVNFFTTTIPAMAANVGRWFKEGWDAAYHWVVTSGLAIITWAAGLPDAVLAYIIDLGRRLGATFNNMWHSAVNYFKNLKNDIVAEARNIPGQVQDAVNSLLGKANDIGRDIVRGIVNGIKSAAGWLYDEAANLARRALQGAKDAIGVKSPSKEFAKLGVWSAKGFIEGLASFDIADGVGATMKMPITNLGRNMQQTSAAATPSVNVGGASLVAYLQIGDDQLHPVVVRTMHENPQDVALAAQQGDTELSRRR